MRGVLAAKAAFRPAYGGPTLFSHPAVATLTSAAASPSNIARRCDDGGYDEYDNLIRFVSSWTAPSRTLMIAGVLGLGCYPLNPWIFQVCSLIRGCGVSGKLCRAWNLELPPHSMARRCPAAHLTG